MAAYTVGLAEAKNNFSKLTAEINRTGKPVTVLKSNKPWVVIFPATALEDSSDIAVDALSSNYAFINVETESQQSDR